VVEGEVGGEGGVHSGVGSGNEGRSSVSHDVVLSGSLAIQKLFFSVP
jgi:hypothetical protein